MKHRLGTMPDVLTGRIGMSPAMIGRTGALHRLRSLIDEADAQSSDLPTVALVAGEAGIGKTRLVREVLDEIVADPAADVVVFAGAAEPGRWSRAYDLVAQLAPAGSSPSPIASSRRGIGGGSPRVRTRRPGDGRTVVVIADDLHWVDAESAGFIDELARSPLPNVVIVATYRPTTSAVARPAAIWCRGSNGATKSNRSDSIRLARHEVGAMMAAIAGTRFSAAIEAVTRRSAGVPFVIEELMRCIGPDTGSGDVSEAQLPWSLEEAVRQQLAGLATVERTVVDALAVLAEPTGFEVLAAVATLDDVDLLAALRDLMGRGVVVEPRDDRLWFAHALVADSVLQQLLGPASSRLHERCFTVLAALAPDDHAALARHALGAGTFRRDRRDRPTAGRPTTSIAAPRSRRCAWRAKGSPRTATSSNCSPWRPRRHGASTSNPRRSSTLDVGSSWRRPNAIASTRSGTSGGCCSSSPIGQVPTPSSSSSPPMQHGTNTSA